MKTRSIPGLVAAAWIAILAQEPESRGQIASTFDLLQSVEVTEGTATVSVTVFRTGDLSGKASLEFQTAAGLARPGEDYTERKGILEFAPGQDRATVEIPILNDGVWEPREIFKVQWSNPVGARLSQTTTTVVILDNDPGISFELAELFFPEASKQAIMTVQRGNDVVLDPFTVDYFSTGRTATPGSDYEEVQGTLSFAAGEMTRTITVPILNDGLKEPVERVLLTLTNAVGGPELGLQRVSLLAIQDNDPGLNVQGANLREDEGPARVWLHRGNDVNLGPVSVQYRTVADFAKAGTDYVHAEGTVDLAEGEMERAIEIALVNDATKESHELFYLELFNPAGGTLSSSARAAIAIDDNDTGIRIYAGNATEGPRAFVTVTVEAGGDAGAFTVDYRTDNGSAVAGLDYEAARGTLQFEPGQASQTVQIPLINDGVRENREIFYLIFENLSNGVSFETSGRAEAWIEDNDGGVNYSGIWGIKEGTPELTVYLYRGNDGDFPMTVDYVTTDGTAVAGADYQRVAGTARFEAGESQKTIQIPLINDAIAEPDEQFSLTLSNPTGGATIFPSNGNNALHIADDDRGPELEPVPVVAETIGVISVGVRRGTDDPRPFTVDFATRNEMALAGRDYVATNGTLTFAAGEQWKYFDVRILDNLAYGARGRFSISISNVTGGLGLGPVTNIFVQLVDDEVSPALNRAFAARVLPDGFVLAAAMLPDGKFLLGGAFERIGREVRPRLARFHQDGTLDITFTAQLDGFGSVSALAVQADGRILVGFTSQYGPEPRNPAQLVRLFPDGRRDSALLLSSEGEPVRGLTPLPDGQFIVHYDYGFERWGANRSQEINLSGSGIVAALPDGRMWLAPSDRVERLLSSGQPDPSFRRLLFQWVEPGLAQPSMGDIRAMVALPDGKVLAGGLFNRVGGIVRNGLVRLQANGEIDESFNPGLGLLNWWEGQGNPSPVTRLAAAADGRVWVGGYFNWAGGYLRNGLARLNADGTVDLDFDVGEVRNYRRPLWGGGPSAFELFLPLPDGDLLVGGSLTFIGGQPVNYFARLEGGLERTRVEFRRAEYPVDRGDTRAELEVERRGDLDATTTVAFATRDETAQAGVHYAAAAGTLAFAPGERSKSIAISLLGSPRARLGRSLRVELTALTGAGALGQAVARVPLLDGESPGWRDRGLKADPSTKALPDSGPYINSIEPLPDGKFLASGGLFPREYGENKLARFLADGSLDPNFAPLTNGLWGMPWRDGRILAARFMPLPQLVRLQADGSVDTSYQFDLPFPNVRHMARASDGKIYLSVSGLPTGGEVPFQVLRLGPDGLRDASFAPLTGSGPAVTDYPVLVAPDRSGVAVAGIAMNVMGVRDLNGAIRLRGDGTRDTGFGPGGNLRVDPDKGAPNILAAAALPDGKVILAGSFAWSGRVPCGSIVRLNADGTTDPGFRAGLGAQSRYSPLNPPGLGMITCLAIQPGGQIVLGGYFNLFDGVPRRGLARLHPDGSLDRSFDPEGELPWPGVSWQSPQVQAMALEANGDILLGGMFYETSEAEPATFVRLHGGLAGGVITGQPAPGLLHLATRPGRSHILEFSEDFASWHPAATNEAAGLTLPLADPEAGASPHRFYRARRHEP